MKRIAGLILILSCVIFPNYAQDDSELIDRCVALAGDDATYLKDFVVKLPAAVGTSNLPVSKNSVLLRKNTVYRFTVCTNDEPGGVAIIRLYDGDRMLAANMNPSSGKIYQSFNFNCSKTGPYTLMISFKDGEKGHAVGIMSYVRYQ